MNDLNPQVIDKRFGQVRIDHDKPAEDVLKELSAMVRKAKKKGYAKLRLVNEYDEGDENTLPEHYIALWGERLEEPLEWHRRLDHARIQIQRNIDTAERTIKVKSHYEGELAAIAAALASSPLRCVDCGKPESGQINSWVTKSKTIRICHKCHELRKEAAEKA